MRYISINGTVRSESRKYEPVGCKKRLKNF